MSHSSVEAASTRRGRSLRVRFKRSYAYAASAQHRTSPATTWAVGHGHNIEKTLSKVFTFIPAIFPGRR